VLRGNPFEWEGKWPHLPAEEASRLVADVISRYTQAMRRPPRRLVVHKQSRFFPEELAGFQDAHAGYEYDMVALAPSTGVGASTGRRLPGRAIRTRPPMVPSESPAAV
jgi:hypothetical protein